MRRATGARSLLLTASFPPALGGVETLQYQTTRRLAEPPLVLAPTPAGAPDLVVRGVGLDLASRLLYRPMWRLHPSLHYLQRFLAPALQAVTAWRPRVIQVGHVYLAPLAWLLARRFDLPFVVYAYGQEAWRAGRAMGVPPADDCLRGGALRAAAAVLVPGEFTASLVADWRVSPQRIVRVPFGAEPHPECATLPPTGRRLLSVARLIPRKGIDTVIRSLRGLPADIAYRVVGRGPDEPRLRALAAAEGVADRVHFLGRLDDAALADEYRRCALFVLPARRLASDGDLEGYGLVYFEAAAWGRPVVAGRSGGESDAVVDGETGVLVHGESLAEVHHAIGALLADDAHRQALGAAGRRRVEATHNWACAADQVDLVLERCAVRGGR